MADLKTIPNDASVEAYIQNISDEGLRHDSEALLQLMQEVTGLPPVMWGSSIVGFGNVHYKYASGHEGDTMAVGFAARKSGLVLYGVIFYDHNIEKLPELGKYKAGKGCLYIKRLADVDLAVLRDMITAAYEQRDKLFA